ncbi:hypothetical protein [Pseudonocardia sp. T1-2H]|uniref:hypothetical protein n=1 Tax=Pseudonocardia sp. T1-2H TaxID=3128899 RepID=UPI0031015026
MAIDTACAEAREAALRCLRENAEPLTDADRAELARRRAKAVYWAEVSARQRAAHGMTSW